MPARAATILHVEDDPAIQKLTRIALSELGGYTVLSVADGFSAIAVAAQRTPDLVLLDLNLPGINGIETLRALREMKALRLVPAVFLTSAAELSARVEMLHLDVVSVLQKPFRPRQLLRAINGAFERKKDRP